MENIKLITLEPSQIKYYGNNSVGNWENTSTHTHNKNDIVIFG